MRDHLPVDDSQKARATADPDVDALMRRSAHPRREEIDVLRAAFLVAVPGLSEHVKWNAPSFVYRGEDRVTFRLHPPHRLQLIFHRGAKVRADAGTFSFHDPTGQLRWPAPDRAVLTLGEPGDAQADHAEIVALVKRWVVATSAAEP